VNPLNPSAGDVPVPEDPREIEAALSAGLVSYRVFPYLEWRYGERGRAFTRSDSAWLAWLTRHDQEHVREQIAWLKGLLSNRGMPSTILELHLEVLHRQLVRKIPERSRQYAQLKRSAEQLRQEREASMSPEHAKRLVEDFVAALALHRRALAIGAAGLLVAAIADEISGDRNAVRSTAVWLADVAALRNVDALRKRLSPADRRLFDSESFAERWQGAVGDTISASGVNRLKGAKQ
jgi:hypothetical protein